MFSKYIGLVCDCCIPKCPDTYRLLTRAISKGVTIGSLSKLVMTAVNVAGLND